MNRNRKLFVQTPTLTPSMNQKQLITGSVVCKTTNSQPTKTLVELKDNSESNLVEPYFYLHCLREVCVHWRAGDAVQAFEFPGDHHIALLEVKQCNCKRGDAC